MNAEQLAALQPSGQTATEIHEALTRIGNAKSSLQNRLDDVRAEMSEKEKSFSLPSALRRKFGDAIADLDQDLQMLDVLAATVEKPLAGLEAAEERHLMGAERTALYDEKIALDDIWDREFQRISAELAALVAARDDFIERVRQRGHNLPGIESFEQRTGEGRLPLTSEQREQQRLVEQQAMRQAEDAIRDAAAAIRDAAAARGPRVMPDATPQPTLTVAGVLQSMPGHGW
jgi:hypothetical protein